MTINIPTDALKPAMHTARKPCPDGGVGQCFDCARKFVQAVLEQLDLHELCITLPNYPIEKKVYPDDKPHP